MELVPVIKTTSAQSAARQILDMIRHGVWKSGDQLPTEKDMIEKLSVGRSTIREALQILATVNVVQATPGHQLITVSWQAPASSGSGPITQYLLAQNHSADFSAGHDRTYASPADAGSRVVFVPGADAGTQYFEVQAQNQYGSGPYSGPASATAQYP